MKVVIPVAGVGTRLRPHTYTQPKPLMPVAGKPIISFIIDKFTEVGITDFVFVIGYLGDKIRTFIETNYPQINAEFVVQEQREGSAHALYSAKNLIENEKEIFIAFGDTIFDVDLRLMLECPYSCVGVKKVSDPRDFGVAEFDEDNFVKKLIEKPKIPKSNMALVGIYKILEVEQLLDACKENIKSERRTIGEFQLTDALQLMVEQKAQMKVLLVKDWFDCGRKEVLLETNAMLLGKKGYSDDFDFPDFENTIIVHPVSIGTNCRINNSIIGPNVSIGDDVEINSSIIQDSIIGNFAGLYEVVLKHSVIGSDATIHGQNLSLNIGDNTEIDFN